jgi:hypothetical protein
MNIKRITQIYTDLFQISIIIKDHVCFLFFMGAYPRIPQKQDIPFAWDISENNLPIIDIVRFEGNVNWVRVKLSLHYLT